MNSKELKEMLKEEKLLYLGNNSRHMRRQHHLRYEIWNYLYYFRICQYFLKLRETSENRIERRVARILFKYFERKKNVASIRSGVEIGIRCKIGQNIDIWHQGVVINGNIGNGCTFHGNNIIGNKGINRENEKPTIGDNVDIGAGAVVIGNVRVANGCKIGANATVFKSVEVENQVIVGFSKMI